jgi:hypothetical protein
MSAAENQPVYSAEIDSAGDTLSIASEIMAALANPQRYTGTGTVKMQIESVSGEMQFVDVGTISGGNVTITLPAVIEDALLTPLTMPEGVAVKPAGAKACMPAFTVFEDDVMKGGLVFGTLIPSFAGVSADAIQYGYFPRATSANGKDTSQTNLTVKVTAKKGWNKLRVYGASSGGFDAFAPAAIDGTITSDLTGASQSMKWWFVASGSSGAETPPTPPGGTIADNAPVYEASYGSPNARYTKNAAVKLRLGAEDTEVGTIAGGVLTITLPDSVDESALISLAEAFGGLTVDPPSARGASATFAVFENGVETGTLILAKTAYSMSNYTNETIQYQYFQDAAAISGDIADDGIRLNVQIDGKQGWNPLYTRTVMANTGTPSVTIRSDLTGLPSGLKWTVMPLYIEE